MQVDFSKIKFDEKGLIPAIIQDAATNAVLMLAYERRITGEDCGNRLYLVLESQPSGAVEQRR